MPLFHETILGERVNLGALSPYDLRVIASLQKHFQSAQQSQDRGTLYLSNAIPALKNSFPRQEGRRLRLNGAVGSVHRDFCYRLLLASGSGPLSEQAAQHLKRLRYDPARLLLDAYLDGWPSKAAFADAAGLELSELSRLFKPLVEGGDPEKDWGSIGLIRTACEKLGLVQQAIRIPTRD